MSKKMHYLLAALAIILIASGQTDSNEFSSGDSDSHYAEAVKTILLGKTEHLYCFESTEMVTSRELVYWEKDGKSVNTSSKLHVYSFGIYQILTIKNAQHSDAGTYTCRNSSNIALTTVNLQIQGLWKVKAEKSHVHAIVGESVLLECTIISPKTDQKGYVVWYGEDLNYILYDERHRIYRSWNKSSLEILAVSIADSGKFFCRGGGLQNMNESGDVIHLNVNQARVTVSPLYKQEYVGSTVHFSCKSDAYPSRKITWTKAGTNGEIASTENTLILANVTKSHEGQYVCEIRLENKRINDSVQLYVEEKPLSRIFRRRSLLLIPLEVRCSTKPVLFLIFKDNKETTLGQQQDTLQIVKKCRYLSVSLIGYDNAGNYTSVVYSTKHNRIIQETTTLVEILGPPPKINNVQASYNCSQLSVSLQKPLNKTFRLWHFVKIQLWQYSLKTLPKVSDLISTNTTESSVVIGSDYLCRKTKSLAVEVVVVGEYGDSQPTLVTPIFTASLGSVEPVINTLHFPETKVLLRLNFNKSNFSAYNYLQQSHLFDQLIYAAAEANVILGKDGVFSSNAISISIDFIDIAFYEAARVFYAFQKVLETKVKDSSSSGLQLNIQCAFDKGSFTLLEKCLEKNPLRAEKPTSSAKGIGKSNILIYLSHLIVLIAT